MRITVPWDTKGKFLENIFIQNELKFIFSFLFLFGIAAYSVGLSGLRYGDDFKFVFDNPFEKIFYFFFAENPNLAFYRPIESMFLAGIQWIFGTTTIPIHSLILYMHVTLCFLIYQTCVSMNMSRIQSWVAAIYMLLAQVNAFAVLSNDTLSQVGGTLCGFLSLRYLLLSRQSTLVSSFNRTHLVSLFWYICALWFKESSISFLLMLTLLTLLTGSKDIRQTFKRSMVYIAPYLCVSIIYLLIRTVVINIEPDERYSFQFGLQILKNVMQLIFASGVPLSTVDVFVALQTGNVVITVTAVILCSAIWFTIFYYVRQENNKRLTIDIPLLILLALFPAVILSHVSELYAYNAMPFISMVFGAGAGRLVKQVPLGSIRKYIIVSGVCFIFLFHITAIQGKGKMMVRNGESADLLLRTIIPYVSSVEKNSTLILVDSANQRLEYSTFIMSEFSTLRFGTNIVRQMSGRHDVQIWILNSDQFKSTLLPQNAKIITYADLIKEQN